MKALPLIIAASLGVGTAALAQQTTVRGNASAESQTSVSADRRGADVASDNRARGGVAVERGNEDGTGRQAAADFAGASEMNATLERSVDARRAKPGDEVTAKMNESFTTANGTTIPRGSRLVGRVTEARPHARGEGSAEGAAASQLGIVFDKAVLKDGREVPMQATIQAVAAARSQAQGQLGSASHDAGAFGSSHAAGGGHAGGGLGSGAIGGIGAAAGGVGATGGGVFGSAAGNAGAAVGGATRLPRSGVGAAASGAGAATARGGLARGSSAGAVGGLSASGQWLAGSRGVFGIGDMELASAAAGSAQGSLITSPSRHVRLDGGTQLLLVGRAGASR